MGIHGLTSFIDKNPHVLHKHELRQCPVVIDGNNFYHYLYYACHVNYNLGGDYDIYRKKIISTFQAFKKCGICPYVVLDGAYTVDDRKLKTSLVRATMRNRLVGIMAHTGRGQVLPILAYDTFVQTLTELNVYHVTCQFEADVEIAVLANKLECPVISNDSDFYIFDLKAGFLPLDYIDFRPLSRSEDKLDSTWYLHCHIYHVDEFINAFKGLNRSILPVFACLIGNDYVNASSFDAFYSRLKVPKVSSKKYDLPPRLNRILSVINWFHVHNKDWSKLLQELLGFLQSHSPSRLRNLFFTSILSYSKLDRFEGCDLFAYFSTDKLLQFSPVSALGFTGYNGANFPKWFLTAVCRGEITPSILNVAVLHRVILLSQMEDLSEVTAYQCSQRVRHVSYGILLKSDPFVKEALCGHRSVDTYNEKEFGNYFTYLMKEQTGHGPEIDRNVITEDSDVISDTENNDDAEKCDDKGDSEEMVAEKEVLTLMSTASKSKCVKKRTLIEEYNRVNKQIRHCFVDPFLRLDEISLPVLSDLEDMPKESRLDILLKAMNIEDSFHGQFSNGSSLYFSCVLMWLRNSEPKVAERHLDCIILCYIFLSIHDKLSCGLYKSNGKLSRKGHDDSKSTDCDCCRVSKFDLFKTIDGVPQEQTQTIYQNLCKFHKNPPTFNKKNLMQIEILHLFAQLQACMLDTSNLNKLLRFPRPCLRPSSLYNGTFLYNAVSDLISRPRPDLYVATLLLPSSLVHNFFLDLKSTLQEFLPSDALAVPPPKGSKKSRKRQKKVPCNQNSKSATGEDAQTRDDDSFHGEESEETVAISGFDISNKFSYLLSLDN